MNLNTALASDLALMDSDSATTSGRHSITITNPDASTGTSDDVIKRASTRQTIDQNGFVVDIIVVRWHVPKNDLSSFVPAKHGYITDGGSNVWRINQVQLETAGTRFAIETTLEGGVALR